MVGALGGMGCCFPWAKVTCEREPHKGEGASLEHLRGPHMQRLGGVAHLGIVEAGGQCGWKGGGEGLIKTGIFVLHQKGPGSEYKDVSLALYEMGTLGFPAEK